MSLWRVLYLSEKYGRMRLRLPEISEQIGEAEEFVQDHAWIAGDGTADVADVVAYIDEARNLHGPPPPPRIKLPRHRPPRRCVMPRWANESVIAAIYAEAQVLDLARQVGTKDLKTLLIYYNLSAEERAKRLK